MQDERNRGSASRPPQDILEQAILHQLLAFHPAVLTITELKRQFRGHDDDELDVALSAVDAAGLANVQDQLVLASYAAVRCTRLLEIA
jgi:hypothetical protein